MKALVLTFILPLGLAMVLLVTGLVRAWRERGHWRTGMGCVLGALVILWLCSTPAILRLTTKPLLAGIDGPTLTNPNEVDAIIVLTGGVYWSGGIGWLPRVESYQRLAVAYELQRMINLRVPVIVSGGHTEGVDAPSEAKTTASFFARHRSELTPTELEEASTNTYESALQMAPVLAKRSANTVLLVTSDIHMLRALAAYRAKGINPIPAPSLSMPETYGVRAWIPRAGVLGDMSDVWYEYLALAYYWVSGKVKWADIAYHGQKADDTAMPLRIEVPSTPQTLGPGDVIEIEQGQEIL